MRITIISLLLLILSSCSSYHLPTKADQTQYRVDHTMKVAETNSVNILISPYKKSLDTLMNEVIGYSEMSLDKNRPESTLGNWIADALQKHALRLSQQPVDFSIQNYGGIRIQELVGGAITLGKVYEIMPFDNLLVIVELKGDVLQLLFDQMAEDGGWPISKEVMYHIQDNKPIDIKISGQKIAPNRIYHIALPDYVANGNDNCGFLADLSRFNTGVLVRDILVSEVKEKHQENQAIKSKISGRVLVD